MYRPIEAIIDLTAARDNLRRATALAQGQHVMAVIKADAYGHGLLPLAHAMSEADAYGVCSMNEAAALRDDGVRNEIVLLEGCYTAEELEEAAKLNLIVIVHDDDQIRLLEQSRPRPTSVWLKINTGMHRLGLPPERAAQACKRLRQLEDVRLQCVMTHLADAGVPAKEINSRQLHRFHRCLDTLPEKYPGSIANSAALLAMPVAGRGDWVRPGIILYGASPVPDSTGADWGFRPVMTLRTRLIAVHQLTAGEQVGYGGTYTCRQNMSIGIAAAGYGDGYPRSAPSGTPVLVEGVKTHTVGLPSMDMMAIDISACPEARPGSVVTLWGEQLPVEHVAACAGSIPHALLCSLQNRVPLRTKNEP